MVANSIKKSLALLVATALVALTAGCAPQASVDDSKKVKVVASTNAWGSLVEEIGGNWVEVTSLVNKPSEDPHSYEATAKDQLLISKADFVIYNGAGFDAFFEQLITKSDLNNSQIIVGASSGVCYCVVEDPHEWFNPWSAKIASAAILNKLKKGLEDRGAPSKALTEVVANYSAVTTALDGLADQIRTYQEESYKFLALETLGYSIAGGDPKSVTPVDLLLAAENEVDFSPALMLEVHKLLKSGQVTFLITNKQVTGSQTEQIKTWAAENKVSIIEFSELIPEYASSYTHWMGYNVRDIQKTLMDEIGKSA